MKLLLVQHGEALSKAIDPQRPLSARGEQDVENTAAMLHRAGVRVERVLHSGKHRAQQTAERLAKAVTPSNACSDLPGMAPNDPVEPLVKTIMSLAGDTLLVGHLPFMSRLVSLLVALDPEQPIVDFLPGSIVCLEGARGGPFAIVWMLRPELLTHR